MRPKDGARRSPDDEGPLEPSTGRHPRSTPCERAADVLLALVVVGGPLLVGVVHLEAWLAVFVLSVAALVLLLVGGRSIPRPSRRLLLLLALVVGLPALPLLPLPESWVASLSPFAAETWALPAPGLDIPAPRPRIHQAPGSGALSTLAACTLAAFGLCAHLRARSTTWRRWAKVALLLSAVVACLDTAVQTWLGAESILGLYTPRVERAHGLSPLINHNHWAAFLGLALVVGAGALVQTTMPLWGRVVGAAGVTVTAVALVLSRSRGGVVGVLAAFMTWYAIEAWRRRGRGRDRAGGGEADGPHRPLPRAVPLALLVVVGAGIAWVAAASRGLVDPHSGLVRDGLPDEPRLQGLPSAVRLILAHPWTGVGRGAFRDVFPRFDTAGGTPIHPHAELGAIDVLADHGLIMGGLTLLVVAGILGTLVRDALQGRTGPAPVAALLGLLVHEGADFSLATGSVSLSALLVLALALPPRRGLTNRRRLALVPVTLLAIALFVLPGLPHGSVRRCIQSGVDQVARSDLTWLEFATEESPWHPSSFPLALEVGIGLGRQGDIRGALTWLNRAQLLAPRHPEPHLWTARTLRAVGALGQATGEFRRAMEGDWTYRARPILEEAARTLPPDWDLSTLVPADRPEGAADLALWLGELGDPRGHTLAGIAWTGAPGYPVSRLVRAMALAAGGELDGSRALVADLLQDQAVPLPLRIRAAAVLGDLADEGAELAAMRAITDQGQDPGPAAWLTIAELELARGREPSARVALRRARAHPLVAGRVRTLVLTALLEARGGRQEAAVELLGEARGLAAGDLESTWLVCHSYAEIGERAAARALATHVLELSPTHSAARALLAD